MDSKKLIGNLLDFYDFKNKTIVSVGSGGGQLIEYGHAAKKIFAIDNNEEALRKLKESLAKSSLDDKFTLVYSDFYLADQKGDVVMFEFCLHEMPDQVKAVDHAGEMADDILVLDHWPESEWAYYVAEDKIVDKSWQALRSFHFRKVQKYEAAQLFKDYEELYQKVKVMGEVSINRINPFIGQKNFSIPMAYGFALI